jgi:histidinol-phosphate aminotransferase
MIEYLALKGGTLIAPRPTFITAIERSHIFNIKAKWVWLDKNFNLDIENILTENPKKGDIVYLANPNNPAGNLVLERVSDLRKLLDTGAYVVIDEVYYEFENPTFVDLVKYHNNLVILRTFSKAFALAGMRIGYAISSPDTLKELQLTRRPYDLCSLSVVAASAALDDLEYMRKIVHEIITIKKWFEENLKNIEGVEYYPSRTNFVLIKVHEYSADQLKEELKKDGILVRTFPYEPMLKNHIRVSISLKDHMLAFLESLAKIVRIEGQKT